MRALTGASRAFFEAPPPGFADKPVMTRRPVLFVAPTDQVDHLRRLIAEGIGLRPLTPEAAMAMVPAFIPGWIVDAAIEDDAFDMDVAAIHQGFLRQLRGHGGTLDLRHRAGPIEQRGKEWHVGTSAGDAFTAPLWSTRPARGATWSPKPPACVRSASRPTAAPGSLSTPARTTCATGR